MNEKELKEKVKEKWKLLNEVGIYTMKDLEEAEKKLVLDIGILGSKPEELRR